MYPQPQLGTLDLAHTQSVIPSVVPGPEASGPPGNLLKMQILGPHLQLPNQKLSGWSWATCILTSPPGDSSAQSSVGIPALRSEQTWKS